MLISELRKDFRSDVKISFKEILYKILFNPSTHLMIHYRIAKYFSNSKFKVLKFIAFRMRFKQSFIFGCQFSLNSDIGEKVNFPHPIGIVIGDGVVIKNNVTIWQNVTLGSSGRRDQPKSYPIIEDGVRIYAGAKILGSISIGRNATIGANAVVLCDVPENKTAIGIPARVI